MQQVVTITLNHVCPMVTGTVPHVGGPIIGPGCSGVLINGVPVSLMGDSCVCSGPPDTIVQGCPGVLVNGVPIVVQNCMTAHGGTIPVGIPGVTISSVNPEQPLEIVTMKHQSQTKNRVLAAVSGNSLREAIKNQEALQEAAKEQEPKIYDLRWEKNGVRLTSEKIDEDTKMVADILNIEDGNSITIRVCVNESDVVKELNGTVQNGKIEIGWDVLQEHFNEQV